MPRKRRDLDFMVQGARNLTGAVSFSLSPGLNFFEGANGAGKSTLIDSVLAWTGRKVVLPVAPGASKIRIHGPQAVVEIGRTRREDGTPSVELVADDSFSALIDPSVKEPKARAKARVEAFLRFRPIPIDESMLLRLCGGDETVAAAVQGKRPEWESLSIDEAAEAARQAANGMALPLETLAAERRAAGNTLLKQAEDLAEDIAEVPEETAANLADQVDRVSRKLGEMHIEARARLDLERQQGEIRETLGARPDLQSMEMAQTIAQEEAADLRRKLRDAEARYERAATELSATRREDAAWLKSTAVLDKPLTGPTAEDIARTEEALASLRERHAAAEMEARRAILKEQAAERLNASSVAEAGAAKYRAVAQTAKADVGRILEEHGLEGVAFIAGELAVEMNGEPRPVEQLSFGERVSFALRVALPAYEGTDLPPVFWLREAFWYALQPAKQDALEALGKERGIYFLIERPTEGGLEVHNRAAREVRPK